MGVLMLDVSGSDGSITGSSYELMLDSAKPLLLDMADSGDNVVTSVYG